MYTRREKDKRMARQGGVTNEMLKIVGREQGPDYMLKILPEPSPGSTGLLGLSVATILTPESSITEVLNVVSYLCSTTRTDALIDTANSVTDNPARSTIGAHDGTGVYAANGAIGVTFIASANARILFDINTLSETAKADAVIPVGILRRTAPGAVNADPTYEVRGAVPPFANAGDITEVMSDCIKQMINILVKTREIFGPKGWTDLFQKVKGGGGSKHAKRTHRRHRRRYSSKQY
jgi:hypothetical protein